MASHIYPMSPSLRRFIDEARRCIRDRIPVVPLRYCNDIRDMGLHRRLAVDIDPGFDAVKVAAARRVWEYWRLEDADGQRELGGTWASKQSSQHSRVWPTR